MVAVAWGNLFLSHKPLAVVVSRCVCLHVCCEDVKQASFFVSCDCRIVLSCLPFISTLRMESVLQLGLLL